MLLLIDPDGLGSYSIVVCLKSLTKNKTVAALDAASWFGVKKRPGLLETTYSFEGIQLLDPADGKISSAKFTEFIKSKKVFSYKITPEYFQEGDEIETGQAFLTDYSESFAFDGIGTFSASMTLYDDVEVQIAKFGEVLIGDTIWMSSNLKTLTYNDGTPILLVNNITDWNTNSHDGTPCCAYPNFNEELVKDYGMLYNWFAATTTDHGGIIPADWQLPNIDDFSTLHDVAGYGESATNLKVTGTNYWLYPNLASNHYGFNAVGSGIMDYGAATYGKFKQEMRMWASDVDPDNSQKALYAKIDNDLRELIVYTHTGVYKEYGFSIRCIKIT